MDKITKMKSMLYKAKNHSKKIIVHLKRHHRKYLFGIFCSVVLTLIGIHFANTISNIFADDDTPELKILTAENFKEFCNIGITGEMFDIWCTGQSLDGIAYGTFLEFSDKIHILDLSYNNISSLEFYYGYQSKPQSNDDKISVKELNLSHNKITEVKSFYAESHVLPYKIDSINFYHNKLVENVEKNIWNMIEIKKEGTIDLSYNNISSIDDGAFSGLFLEKLILHNNNLSEISSRSFDGIASLKELDLGVNFIYNIKLNYITGLTYLFLDKNCISTGTMEELNNTFSTSDIVFTGNNDEQYACFYLDYNPNKLTNGDVEATITLTGNGDFIRDFKLTTGFVTTGTKYFDVSEMKDKSEVIRNYPENDQFPATVTWIDKEAPTCDVWYNKAGPTNQNVTAKLTGCSEEITCTNCNNGTVQHIFTGNGNFTFEFKDAAGNTGSTGASVTWIDKTGPICSVMYSITGFTNQNVVAYLTGCNEGITCTNCNNGTVQYTFTGNGNFTFEFKDAVGNTGSTGASVTWIDKAEPICSSIQYSTTSPTSGSVTATLTGCGNDIDRTGSVLTHIFTGENESFTFHIKDNAGNSRSTGITVDWIDHTKPTCNVAYEFQLISGNHSTLAKLVNCSESGNVINNSGSTEYSFLSSGNFKFEFQDSVGNTGSAEAIVSYINNSGDIISLYNASKALSCRNYYKSGNSSEDYKLYVTTGAVYLYLNASIEGTGIDSHILLADDKLYQWGSSYSQYFGSGEGVYQIYRFNIENEIASFFNDDDFYFICYTGINNMSIFDVPNNIIFRTQGHYLIDSGIFFSISVDDTIKAGEYTDLTVKIMKDGAVFKDYTGTIYFDLRDGSGRAVNHDFYYIPNNGWYDFKGSDKGKKTFRQGLMIKKPGTYQLEVYDSDDIIGSEIITVTSNGSSSDFEYDTYKFNPKYSDEMNKAYQYSRYYNITTIDNIKDAGMTGGLNRIAMAKMLSNYAINVLGKNDFDRNRDCTFKDVSASMDKNYDYGVTKACQLGIMGVNMPDNKFYPKGGVTRAEFATALSRLLYGTKDGTDKYYSTHINKLYREGIISNTDPKLWEKRGYIMLMLMRAMEK